MPEHRWTISILTIPGREQWLERLVASLAEARVLRRAALSLVFNRPTTEPPSVVEGRLRRLCHGLSVSVAFNETAPTIAAGRQQQLNACKTPLIAFLDDDTTVHGPLLDVLEDTLLQQPVGLVGIPSFVNETGERFKPRDSTPHVTRESLRYTPVQGMLVAGYRRLVLDAGGFNLRRAFWGEWTELNLRLWRLGFPSAYAMSDAFLRHWEEAPDSPTRNRAGRERDILWGLMCTALEYDAESITPSSASFWRLVRERYLAYAFGPSLTVERLLSECLALCPAVTAEWPRIVAFREEVRRHPFAFAPFHTFTADDVDRVTAYATPRLARYRSELPPARRDWRAMLGARWRAGAA